MPSRPSDADRLRMATAVLVGVSGAWGWLPLHAAPALRPGYAPGGCPWIVPWGLEFVQPTRIPSDRVEAKNAGGCLSQNDAIYSPDGCPLRFCNYREVGPLPPADPSVKLQLPAQPPLP